MRRLADFVALAQTREDVALADLAFTLQVGREAMEERFGLVAASLSDLHGQLTRFLDGTGRAHRGRAGQVGEGMDDSIRSWLAQGHLDALVEHWVQGHAVDWRQLYAGRSPRRISLPTYPFATERYWLSPVAAPAASTALHPLVQRNTSTLAGPRFSSEFTNDLDNPPSADRHPARHPP